MSDANLGPLVLSLVVLLFSLTVHEAAHAFAADRLGDATARLQGRLSLNPLVHIDPIGTVLLPLIAAFTGAPLIGWAKPVPVNGARLRNFRRDFMAIAAAGPASNLLLAVGATVLLRLLPPGTSTDAAGLPQPVAFLLFTTVQLNLLLAVFNMIPVPPLDGGNVLSGLLPAHLSRVFDWLRPYGIFILYALMLSGALSALIQPPYRFLEGLLLL